MPVLIFALALCLPLQAAADPTTVKEVQRDPIIVALLVLIIVVGVLLVYFLSIITRYLLGLLPPPARGSRARGKLKEELAAGGEGE